MDEDNVAQFIELLKNASTFPLEVQQALIGRGFIKAPQTTFTGSFYVAASSGGSPTHKVTVSNGVIISVS